MAVDVVSPRISFSYDLNQAGDVVPVEPHQYRSDSSGSNSTIDFDFCITSTFAQEFPSADELFANGKILPIQIKKGNEIRAPAKKRLKEFLSCSPDMEEEEKEKPASKPSFWQFRRSTSLNCDNGSGRGFIRALQSLSRSNSTGSAPNAKQNVVPKAFRRQDSRRQPSFASSNPSSSPLCRYQSCNSSKKPPLKKSCSRSYGNGVRVSPVLNIPAACISMGSGSLFGFGLLFCNGKAKKKNK
ncbi:hypothetical protein RJ639_040705 [Escallonia herrerae]|uniref:Uncharacterized protein n=1 Tax=Escallonia herrerae TaxID=1293975 RepID=A0AA88WK54_9ASTE|nr:hypothetical protein RJ639_040705 [Escallonia herrerae]